MPTIQFKAKAQTVYNTDGTVSYTYVKVPTLTRNHCDMNAFRSHPRFGCFANSDVFLSLLKRATSAIGLGKKLRLDRDLPRGVTVDASGFLHEVTIHLD